MIGALKKLLQKCFARINSNPPAREVTVWAIYDGDSWRAVIGGEVKGYFDSMQAALRAAGYNGFNTK